MARHYLLDRADYSSNLEKLAREVDRWPIALAHVSESMHIFSSLLDVYLHLAGSSGQYRPHF